MMVEKAFVSGSLGQAIFYKDGGYEVLDVRGRKPRRASPNEIYFFRNMAREWISAHPEGWPISLNKLKEILKKEVALFKGLDGLLVGMDPDMSDEMRSRAILRANRILRRDKEIARQVARRFYVPVDPKEWNPSIGIETARANGAGSAEAFYRPLTNGLVDQIAEAITVIVTEQLGLGVDAAVYRKRLMRSGLIAEMVRIIEEKDAYQDIVDLVYNTDFPELSDNTARILIFGLAGILYLYFNDMKDSSRVEYLSMLLSIGKRLSLSEEKNIVVQRGLGLAHIRLGTLYQNLDNIPKAWEHYEAFLPIGNNLFSVKSNNIEIRRDVGFNLIFAHGKLAELNEYQGDIPNAEKHCKALLLIAKRLSDTKPESSVIQQVIDLSFAYAYAKFGDLYMGQNNMSKARIYYEKSLSTIECLSITESRNPSWVEAIYAAHLNIGSLYEKLGKVSKAIEHYTSSLSISENLSDDELITLKWLINLDLVHDRLGMLYARQKDVSKAVEHYESSLSIGKRLFDSEPDNIYYLYNLDITYDRLGVLCEKKGDVLKAVQYYECSLLTGTRLLATEPEDITVLQSVGFVYYRLGVLYEEKGDFSNAQRYYNESLSLVERWYDAESNNTEAQQSTVIPLLLLHHKCGGFYENEGNLSKAKNHYQSSLSFVEIYLDIEKRPDIILHSAIVYQRLGGVYQKEDDLSQAKKHYELSLLNLNNLFASNLDNAALRKMITLFTIFAHCSLGKLYEKEKNIKQIRDHYKSALSFREHLSVDEIQDAGLWQTINRILDSVEHELHILNGEENSVLNVQEQHKPGFVAEDISNVGREPMFLQEAALIHDDWNVSFDREQSTVNVDEHSKKVFSEDQPEYDASFTNQLLVMMYSQLGDVSGSEMNRVRES